jgi:hypothetical protein
MAKGDISWTRRTDAGDRVEIYVEHIGDRWIFHSRPRRPEQWRVVPDPPLEDWLELLDAVNRRIGRQLLKPEEADRIRKTIQLRYPSPEGRGWPEGPGEG